MCCIPGTASMAVTDAGKGLHHGLVQVMSKAQLPLQVEMAVQAAPVHTARCLVRDARAGVRGGGAVRSGSALVHAESADGGRPAARVRGGLSLRRRRPHLVWAGTRVPLSERKSCAVWARRSSAIGQIWPCALRASVGGALR